MRDGRPILSRREGETLIVRIGHVPSYFDTKKNVCSLLFVLIKAGCQTNTLRNSLINPLATSGSGLVKA